jgi:hypothetical protein
VQHGEPSYTRLNKLSLSPTGSGGEGSSLPSLKPWKVGGHGVKVGILSPSIRRWGMEPVLGRNPCINPSTSRGRQMVAFFTNPRHDKRLRYHE